MRRRWIIVFIAAAIGCGPAPESIEDTGPGPHDSPSCTSFWPEDRGPRGDGDLTCSAAEEGRTLCRAPTSGDGWECRRGCWGFFFDGPCAPPSWRPDGGPVACFGPGGPVWSCRGSVDGIGGTCPSGYRCEDQRFADLATRALPTLESTLGVPVGEPDPDHPGFSRVAAAPDPSESVPISIATGSLCTVMCDASAATDWSCGPCATCAVSIGTIDVMRVSQLYPEPMRPFGAATGWCRGDCTFDPDTRGYCPDGHTCSPAENVCVEGCDSDAECQARIVATWDGGVVSILDPLGGTCDPTTLRCRWTHPATQSVGDACVRNADCTEHIGRCLLGGTCAELECERASDTDPATFECDGGRGLCLGNGGNGGSTCVAGCVRSEDCLPGNACVPLAAGTRPAASFSGYCIGLCDTFASDPDGSGPFTDADDVLFPCRASERCDVPPATVEVPDPDGRCRAPCTTDADCAPPMRCELSASAGETVCREPVAGMP